MKNKFVNLMKKSIPLSLALLLAFNTTLAAVVMQHYLYKSYVKELLAYMEDPEALVEKQLAEQAERLEAELLPEEGVTLPVKWNDLGKRLVATGVIDEEKFMDLFKSGPLSDKTSEYKAVLSGNYGGNIVLTKENSRFVLNTLWALGLAQKSDVLDSMVAEYPEIENLAATGGWTVGESNAMNYYGKFDLLNLSSEQQSLVTQIAENIYRPCCGNHTAFADCNHGMAMLGLVELMVSEGYSEGEIYDAALAVNTIWFPDTYLTLAKYMEEERGLAWNSVDSKEVLGNEFSSGSGYRKILAQVNPLPSSGGGGSCGV